MGIFGKVFGGKAKADEAREVASTQLQRFLNNQFTALAKEGQHVHINEITVGYVMHLLMFITKKTVDLDDVRYAMKKVFTDQSATVMIANALHIFQNDVEGEKKVAALFPIVKKEYAAGSGDFLVRHSRKVQAGIARMFSDEDFDPTKVPSWTEADLA